MVTISSYTPHSPLCTPHLSLRSHHSDVTCQALFRMWIARPTAQRVSCRGRIEPIKEMVQHHQMPLIISITSFALLHVNLCSCLFVCASWSKHILHLALINKAEELSCVLPVCVWKYLDAAGLNLATAHSQMHCSLSPLLKGNMQTSDAACAEMLSPESYMW